MARRRQIIRLPFLKFKINKKTIFNIIGFFLLGVGVVFLLSNFSLFATETDGRILSRINETMAERFGSLKIFVPFLIFLLATHFFNTKKLKMIRPNVTVGAIMIYFSVL